MSNETKWLPGLWRVILEDTWIPDEGFDLFRDVFVQIGEHRFPLGKGRVSENTAHLIAVAPELYEALDNLLDELYSTPEINLSSWGISTDDARAALAKARGE